MNYTDDEAVEKVKVHLAEGIRLREELWGGIAFHRGNGMVVDLGKGAFSLLSHLKEKQAVGLNDLLTVLAKKGEGEKSVSKLRADTIAVLQKLVDLGLVNSFPEDSLINQACLFQPAKAQPSPGKYHLSAPETVHWAITFACNQNCPDCYARRYSDQGVKELNTAGALRVIEKLARWGVFQLALGGGEPLLRPDLPLLVKAAKDSGLVVHITTGLIADLDIKLLERLAPAVKSLHIGIKHDRLLEDTRGEMVSLGRVVDAAEAMGLRIGANLILCNTVLKHFGQIMRALVEVGFKRIILLRYKPPSDLDRWLAESPSPQAYTRVAAVLPRIKMIYPHIELRLDCALSFLQRDLKPQGALAAGLKGCVAASRVLALAADGFAYPCSQLMDTRFRAGHIISEDCHTLWNSKQMKKYRLFREKASFRETYCGTCLAREHCGGCRVFAHDALGEDPGCGKPLLPRVQHLGPSGRKAALRAYFENNSYISIEKYMEHFRVGRRRAVKELRNTDWLMPKKVIVEKEREYYIKIDTYQLYEIQDLIGCTPGGAPFVSREEISTWLEEPGHDYPRWLLPGGDRRDPLMELL